LPKIESVHLFGFGRLSLMDRRQFLHNTVLLPAASYVASQSAGASPGGPAGADTVGLREKFFGCIAGCHVGSALKGPCEGWFWQDVEAKFGTINGLDRKSTRLNSSHRCIS